MEDKNYEYNPLTDKYKKVSDSKPLSGEMLDAVEVKRNEDIKKIRAQKDLRANEELYFALNRDAKRVSKEIDEKIEREKIIEQDKLKLEASLKRKAVMEAHNRYRKKSTLYRFFHKSIYKMSRNNMTIDEINNLYKGK